MTIKLVIRDEQGHKKAVSFESRIDHLKFATAFNAMFRKHVSEDNTTFIIERPDDDESLTMETAVGIIERRRGDEPPQYTRYYPTGGGMANIWGPFAARGYAALDDLMDWINVKWVSDRASILPDDSYVNFELAVAEGYRQAEQRRREIRALPKLDRKALAEFCRMWGNHGHNEYDGDTLTFHVLFDGGSGDDEAVDRNRLMSLIETLGLELAVTPPRAPEGSVWVHGDPRVDLELEKWS